MMGQSLLKLGERVFPEREVVIGTADRFARFTLASWVQVVSAAVVLGAISVTSAFSYHVYHQENVALASAQEQLVVAQAVAATATQKLQELAAAPSADSSASTDPAALAQQVSAKIEDLQHQLQVAAEQKTFATVPPSLPELTVPDTQAALTPDSKRKLSRRERRQKQLAADREKLRAKVSDLERRLHRNSASSHAPLVGDETAGADAGAGPTPGGFNLDAFLTRLGIGMRAGRNTGGPYVALSRGASLDPVARDILKSVPLTAPLDHYQLESGFGVRIDPFNGHRSIHTGLDLSAPYQSPVYSTSPGVVVFSGYSAAYGKLIEIDHGNGLHTRYAHLNRLLVNVGQHVEKHVEIGLLGSTGRSTGPHVHYEVLVNGTAQDPAKFFAAGRSIGVVRTAD